MKNIEIKGNEVEVKFGFGALYQANAKYSNVSAEGESMNDGAVMLFSRVVEEDVTVLTDIIDVLTKGKYKKDDLVEAVENFTDEGDDLEGAFSEFKEEMKNSGFFKKAVNSYLKKMQQAKKMSEERGNNQDEVKGLEMIIKSLEEIN